MKLDNYVEDFEEFFQARQEEACANVPVKDRERLEELLDEQKRFTAAIIAKMVPCEDKASLLSELETTLTLIGELSHRHIYTQGLRDGARLARVLG